MKQLICRCEEVLLSEIVDAMENGAITEKALKLKTRAGMGICQGRTCRPLLEQIVFSHRNREIPQASKLSFRIPIRPLKLSDLANTGEEYENEN